MEYFYEILWGILGAVGTALATWLTTRVTSWLNTKIKDKKMAMHTTKLFDIIKNAVQSVFQSFVDTLKKNNKFDADAQEEAKEKAYKIIINELTPELKDYITNNFGDIKAYLMNQIESMIYRLKNK